MEVLFDVTIVQIEDREYRALATDGDVQLGGVDWDQRLVDFLADQCIQQLGQDPRNEPNSIGHLWR